MSGAKSFVVNFTKIKNPVKFNYSVNDFSLVRNNFIKDIGDNFMSSLSPIENINSICASAYKNLGFIFRIT